MASNLWRPPHLLKGVRSLFNDLKEILVSEFGIEAQQIHPETRLLEELSFDSLQMMEMVMILESQYGISIDVQQALKFTTIADVIFHLETRLST